MKKSNCQKIKLLKLLEILQQETDEDHPIGTPVICKRLNNIGISCDRRTMYKDIETLNAQGFEIRTKRLGAQNAYYSVDRRFNIGELKILIDAVQAANFITDAKTKELVDKIAALAGSRIGDVLASSVVRFNTTKHTNEEIYATVEVIEKATREKHPVSFYYFDLDENKNRIYRKEKMRYSVEPFRLVLSEDNYYLYGYSTEHEEMRVYRLDRMEGVQISEEAISEQAQATFDAAKDNVEEGTSFSMFRGESAEVTLYFEQDLINAVYDRFGEATRMTRVNSDHLVAAVKVQLSPVFYGWVAEFGGKMQIISPNNVVKGFKEHVANVVKAFENLN